MVGPKKQVFWPKINILKGNYWILGIEIVASRHILGIILENKASQKLNLSKNAFYKKYAPKFILAVSIGLRFSKR